MDRDCAVNVAGASATLERKRAFEALCGVPWSDATAKTRGNMTERDQSILSNEGADRLRAGVF